jgi:hypothetical protein
MEAAFIAAGALRALVAVSNRAPPTAALLIAVDCWLLVRLTRSRLLDGVLVSADVPSSWSIVWGCFVLIGHLWCTATAGALPRPCNSAAAYACHMLACMLDVGMLTAGILYACGAVWVRTLGVCLFAHPRNALETAAEQIAAVVLPATDGQETHEVHDDNGHEHPDEDPPRFTS